MNFPEYTQEITKDTSSKNSSPNLSTVRPTLTAKVELETFAVNQSNSSSTTDNKQHLPPDELARIVQEAQDKLDKSDVKLKFNIRDESDVVQIEVVDDSGKTIRKIPDDEFIKLSESLKKLERGFIDTTS